MAKVTGAVKHTHQYFKREDGLWACSGIDECSHYMPKNMAPLPVGRLSICWRCEKPFKLLPMNMADTHPKCDDCIEILDAINKLTEEKLSKVTVPSGDLAGELMRRARKNQEARENQSTIQPPDKIEVFDPEE